jgi:hypothetical protein
MRSTTTFVLPEEHTKQFDEDEIISILDQAKATLWHEAMVNAKLDIFEVYH